MRATVIIMLIVIGTLIEVRTHRLSNFATAASGGWTV